MGAIVLTFASRIRGWSCRHPAGEVQTQIESRIHKNPPVANYLRNLMAQTGVPTIALA
jgi:hypothetical protein